MKLPLGRPPVPREHARGGPSLTRTGMLPGTPAYIAPELVRGRTHITPAADIFAFGVIAYELLTGRRPFDEPPALALLADREVVWPASLSTTHAALPAELAELVDRCLAERPQARPAAAEIVERLEVQVTACRRRPG